MKHLQTKYNLLQIFYWMAVCSMYGFTAIFLSSKGLSNTGIGAAAGGACILSIFFSPLLSSLSSKYNKISLQQYLMAGMAVSALCYVLTAFIELPAAVLIVLFMIGCCISMSLNSFLSQISMDYIEDGAKLSFGTARGLGSISYAISAVLFTQLASWFTPSFLALMFAAAAGGFTVLLQTIQPVYAKSTAGQEKSGTLTGCIQRYPVYFLILVGFALVFAAAAALATYLINIIHVHGGSDSLYGIAVYCMAASEMPVMAASDKLIKRFGSMKLIAAAGLFYVLRNTLIAASPNLGILLLGMAFQGVSFGLMTAVITVYVSQNLKKPDQVMGQTMICLMTTGVGSTIGNVLGGWMIDNMGMEALFSGCIVITLEGAAIMIAACCTDFLAGKARALKDRIFSPVG